MGVVKPLKNVSEATREREVYRHDPLLFAGFAFFQDGEVPPSHRLHTARDSVLTGLAQLGAYQTGTERAFISFFDPNHQYIVAEATPSMRIAPSLPSESCPEPLRLCGAAIPRHQGTCDHVLFMEASVHEAEPAELPLSFVPDIAKDSRFSSRPYCQFGHDGQFYASVPIRTPRGINIGALCVMSSVQPESWDEHSTQHLRDISAAISDHLELKRAKREARSHARVNRGISSFIAGKGTLTGWQSAANADAFMDDAALEGALNVGQQRSEHHEDSYRHEKEETASIKPYGEESSHGPQTTIHHSSSPATSQKQTQLDLDEDKSRAIFSKAANIIREAFEIEGSAFLDVAVGSYRKPSISAVAEIPTVDEASSRSGTPSSSDEQTQKSATSAPEQDFCEVLGFSTTDVSSVDDAALRCSNRLAVAKGFLAKLLRRYPSGKIFNFDAIGELQTSDSSPDDAPNVYPDSVKQPRSTPDEPIQSSEPIRRQHHGARYSRSREGSLIHQAFPQARSVAFIPVWDPKRERWFAGGFIWTLHPNRVFTTEGELALLGAFAKLISAELLNVETVRVDRAKSDALGALSHELRSPLHGVILSTDLLNDTDLSVFQGNAIHTIETCGRTLLDTIEHLLDYSKINSFAAKGGPESARGQNQRKGSKSDVFGKKSLFKHTRIDALVESVVESVFAGFNFQHMSVRQLSKETESPYADTAAHHRLDAELALEQMGPSVDDKNGKRVVFENTSVYITIDPSHHWLFYVQPGALRRIVMNLVGNSLKYTAGGHIRISLSQKRSKRSSGERLVTLTVQDKGKGMSQDYLRHGLFKPFSQEDELMPGTGLGLSLIKKIVSQMNGDISVQSELGMGTMIAVTLPLESTPVDAQEAQAVRGSDLEFEDQVRQLKSLRIGITGFGAEWGSDGQDIVESICRRWVLADIVSDEERAPEIMIWSEDALPTSMNSFDHLARIPNVVVCRDALAAYRLSTKHVGLSSIFEFLSQPLGPRALARSLLRAYERWAGLPKDVPIPSPVMPIRARSADVEGQPSLNTATASASLSTPELRTLEGQTSAVTDGHDSAVSTSEQQSTIASDQLEEMKTPKNPNNDKRTFLLVDDNQINLKVLSAYMKKLGQCYQAAVNGKEALEAYLTDPGKFAAILMDISMPVMDGLEATRHIRAHERHSHLERTVILALTGLASSHAQQEALESGVDVFLSKPVGLSALTKALNDGGVSIGRKEDALA